MDLHAMTYAEPLLADIDRLRGEIERLDAEGAAQSARIAWLERVLMQARDAMQHDPGLINDATKAIDAALEKKP